MGAAGRDVRQGVSQVIEEGCCCFLCSWVGESLCKCGLSSSAPPWAVCGAANHRPTLPPF